jgi:hypothetical protein
LRDKYENGYSVSGIGYYHGISCLHGKCKTLIAINGEPALPSVCHLSVVGCLFYKKERNVVYSDITLTKKVAIIKAALDKAEALIIGAGAGLSRTRLRERGHRTGL